MKRVEMIWPSIFRAIAIAKTGEHSVTIVTSHKYKEAKEDYASIKQACKGWFENFVAYNGDIELELYKPTDNFSADPYPERTGADSLDVLKAKVENAKLHTVKKTTPCASSVQLLNISAQRLNLSLKRTETVKAIAQTIARYDLEEKLEAFHTAEAIQYNVDRAVIFSCEDEAVRFDSTIIIKSNASPEAMRAAIDYLEGCL